MPHNEGALQVVSSNYPHPTLFTFCHYMQPLGCMTGYFGTPYFGMP